MAKSLQALWKERPRSKSGSDGVVVGTVQGVREKARRVALEQSLLKRMHALYKAAQKASQDPRLREDALWTMAYLSNAKGQVQKQASQVRKVLETKEKAFADWLRKG